MGFWGLELLGSSGAFALLKSEALLLQEWVGEGGRMRKWER